MENTKKIIKNSALVSFCALGTLVATSCGTYGVTTQYYMDQNGQVNGIVDNTEKVGWLETVRTNNAVNVINSVFGGATGLAKATAPAAASIVGSALQYKSNSEYYHTVKSMNHDNNNANITVINKTLQSLNNNSAPAHHHHPAPAQQTNPAPRGGNVNYGGTGTVPRFSEFRGGNVQYCISTEPAGAEMVQLDWVNGVSIKDKVGNMYNTPFGKVVKHNCGNGLAIYEALDARQYF
ncbi:MAG: hypothetical protein J6Y03_04370 [Alphaproteobacteria bacterium]|nr:hypothetical protein [Alphaproteobacteria bacterium]